MRTLIVYVTESHGNTEKVARAMAEALGAICLKPDEVDPQMLANYDLIGLGSGIFYGKHHEKLIEFVEKLPELKAKVFIFSTSGFGTRGMHRMLKEVLARKKLEVVDEFACKGYDTWTPLKAVGGINKGRPNAEDLARAREFAQSLKSAVR